MEPHGGSARRRGAAWASSPIEPSSRWRSKARGGPRRSVARARCPGWRCTASTSSCRRPRAWTRTRLRLTMFDLRYHVASLAAVFLALVIGILVGVGISSGGFVSKGERSLLNSEIDELQRSLDAARVRTGDLSRTQRGATMYVEESYPLLMADRLASRRVALVFVGPVDAGGPRSRRAHARRRGSGRDTAACVRFACPSTSTRSATCSTEGPPSRGSRGPTQRASSAADSRRSSSEVGRRPVWRLLSPQLVAERAGNEERPADAVVVARSVPPQQGATSRLLRGFYEGLASSGVPAVGVETSQAPTTAVDAFDKASLSSVDFVDTEVGRLALALLLAGAGPAATASSRRRPTASCRRSACSRPRRSRRAVSAAPTILIAARDEEARIGETIAALRRELPDAAVIVADDGSRDRTAAVAEQGGARVRANAAARQGTGAHARGEGGAGGAAPAVRCGRDGERWRRCWRRARTSPSRRSPSGRAAASASPSGRRARSFACGRASSRASRCPASGRCPASAAARRSRSPPASVARSA